jgi:hypothetical protein
MNEEQLFNYLKKHYIYDLSKCEDQFSSYDCFSTTYRCVIELKCRTKHYYDLMLEKTKYDSLKKLNCSALYINSTPKGIYIFNINDIKPNWITDTSMPKQTEFSNNDKIEKTYTLISVHNSIKI